MKSRHFSWSILSSEIKKKQTSDSKYKHCKVVYVKGIFVCVLCLHPFSWCDNALFRLFFPEYSTHHWLLLVTTMCSRLAPICLVGKLEDLLYPSIHTLDTVHASSRWKEPLVCFLNSLDSSTVMWPLGSHSIV